MISYKSLKTYVIINTILILISVITQFIIKNVGISLCGFLFMLIKNLFFILGIEFTVNRNKNNSLAKYTKWNTSNITYLITTSIVDIIVFQIIAEIINVNFTNINYFYSLIFFIPLSFFVEVIFDFFHYWAHRIAHINPIYKYIHKTHHSAKELTGIITFHQDPIDYIFSNFIPLVLSLIIVKNMIGIEYNLFDYSLIMTYKEFIEIAGHIDTTNNKAFSFPQFVWLPIFLNIEMKQIIHHNHHKYVTCNYSKRFNLWDKFFGTYKITNEQQ